DYQAKFIEFNFLLDQRVRPDHQMSIAVRDVTPCVALGFFILRSSQQDHTIASVLQDLTRGKIMLRGQYLRGGHQRDLVAVFNRDDGGLQRNNRLTRAYVALQQATHWRRLLHVSRNFFENSLLSGSGMERQDFLNSV